MAGTIRKIILLLPLSIFIVSCALPLSSLSVSAPSSVDSSSLLSSSESDHASGGASSSASPSSVFSSDPGSSASASSFEETSSSGSAPSSSAPSASSSSQSEDGLFRIDPIVSADGESCPVYDIACVGGKYLGTETQVISAGQECLTYESVCLYYEAFRSFPPNYKESRHDVEAYGGNGRLVSTYDKTQKHSSDYTTAFGTFNRPADGVYYEFDIDLDGTYSAGNRGAGRVVIVADGLTDYGYEPVCFFTDDHYADFREFYNFRFGWSPLFAGVENSSGSYHNVPVTDSERPLPATVSWSLAA